MPIQVTTDLPDSQNLRADASVEDELTAIVDDTTNYGGYRWQYRVHGSGNAYTDLGTTGQNDPDIVISNLDDGEKYDVRCRTETEHVTGAWAEIAPVTLLPAPSGLSASNVTDSSADYAWTDNSDNEDAMVVLRAQEYADGYGPYSEVDALAPNTTSYTDTTLTPGETYKVKVRSRTEHVYADSGVVTITANGIGIQQGRVPSQGWYVEVDHPDGRTLTPIVLEGATRQPRLNGLPRMEIPVPRDETWSNKAFDGAPIRVWKDGVREPVDELTDVTQEPDRSVLEAVGGVELQRRTQLEVTEEDAHLVAENLITAETSYTANVDDPASTTKTDYLMQDADSTTEWENVLPGAPFASTDPRTVTSGGELTTHQTTRFLEAEDMASNDEGTLVDGQYSGKQSVKLRYFDNYIDFEFTLEHAIPSGEVQAGPRIQYLGSTHPGYDVILDGTTIQSYSADADPLGGSDQNVWDDIGANVGGLSAGSHTLTIDVTAAASDDSYLHVDCALLADKRYLTRDSFETISDGELQTLEFHPQQLDVESADAVSVESVVAGDLQSTWDDVSRNQQVAISHDQGSNWTTAANSETVSGTFASGSAQIRARFRLSSYDSGSGPVKYDSGQSVDLYELYADLDDTPLVVNQTWDADVVDILAEIAESHDFVWQVVRDPSTSSGYSVEWTQPGQRSASSSSALQDYEVSRDHDVTTKAVIYGVAQSVRGESFTANHGTAVGLAESDLVPVSARVYDPSSGTVFEAGSDYEVGWQTGEITTLSSGSMTDGDTYEIDYEWRLKGEYALPSHSGDPRDEFTETVPEAHSSRACGQLALALVRETSSPRTTASVRISDEDSLGWNLVDQLDIDGLPASALEVYSVDADERGQRLQLGNRDEISQVLSDLQRRLQATSRRV